MKALPQSRPTRRQFLLSGVAACAILAMSRAQAEADLDKFMALSRQLTDRDDLDPALGDIYLHAFDEVPSRAATLQRMLDYGDDESLEFRSIKQQILRQWYTGVVQKSDGPHVATIDQALMWDAVGMQPVGLCRGPVGYWAEAPST